MKSSPMPRRTKPLRQRAPLGCGKPLRSSSALKRTQLRPVSNKHQGRETLRLVTTADTIPPAVRQLVHKRDDRICIRDGSTDGIHLHHRRLKGSGGDQRAHTDCPCNLVSLCRSCHEWAHAHRREAEAEGLIMSSSVIFPGSEPVMVHCAGGGFTAWPACAGEWVFESPAGAA